MIFRRKKEQELLGKGNIRMRICEVSLWFPVRIGKHKKRVLGDYSNTKSIGNQGGAFQLFITLNRRSKQIWTASNNSNVNIDSTTSHVIKILYASYVINTLCFICCLNTLWFFCVIWLMFVFILSLIPSFLQFLSLTPILSYFIL